MASFAVVVADPESGAAYQQSVDGQDANRFIGRSIGEDIDGDAVGLPGYRITLTGGSDDAGRPMHPDISGPSLTEILTTGGVGYKQQRDGERRRVTVRGKQISEATVQVNATISEHGDEAVEDLLGEGADEDDADDE